MKTWWLLLPGLLLLGGVAFVVTRDADPAIKLRPVVVRVPSGRQISWPEPDATTPASSEPPDIDPRQAEATRATQAYFAAHIGRLKQIAFTDYPQALAYRKSLSAQCDAIKKFGRNRYDGFQREHEKVEREIRRRFGDDYTEDNLDSVMLLMLGVLTFFPDALRDQTVAVEGITVSNMVRELAQEPLWLPGHKKWFTQIERDVLRDEGGAQRLEAVQSGRDLLAFLEAESGSWHARMEEVTRRAGFSAEEADYLAGRGRATMIKDVADQYQDLPDVAHKKLFAEYEETVRALRGLLDQAVDGEEKRVIMTELADLQAQMRSLGKG